MQEQNNLSILIPIRCNVIFQNQGLECGFYNAKKIKIDCFCCSEAIILKLTQKSWKCPHCHNNISPYAIIYKATRKSDGLGYVGQTRFSLRERIGGHLRDYTEFDNELRLIGPDSFYWEIIDFVSGNNMRNKAVSKEQLDSETNNKEIKWIKEFDTFNNGFNNTTGGNNFSMSKYSIAKFSGENHGLAKLTEEQIKIIRLLKRDTGMTSTEISKVVSTSISNVSDILTKDAWSHITIDDTDTLSIHYQTLIDEYPKDRFSFLVFNVETKECVGEFTNQRACAFYFGVDPRNLNNILKVWQEPKYNKKTANNYTFIKKQDYTKEWEENILPTLKRNHGKGFKVFNFLTGEYINHYTNQKNCAQDLKLKHSAVNTCLCKKQAYHYEYIFIYDEEYSDDLLCELIELAKINKIKSRH